MWNVTHYVNNAGRWLQRIRAVNSRLTNILVYFLSYDKKINGVIQYIKQWASLYTFRVFLSLNFETPKKISWFCQKIVRMQKQYFHFVTLSIQICFLSKAKCPIFFGSSYQLKFGDNWNGSRQVSFVQLIMVLQDNLWDEMPGKSYNRRHNWKI